MKFWATEYVKTAGHVTAPVGALLGGGLPGLIGYQTGIGDTPEENRGFWRPALYGGAGLAAGGLGGALAGGALGRLGGRNAAVTVPLGVALGGLAGSVAGGAGGGYLAAKQQRELPR